MGPPFLRCESHPGRPLTDHLADVAGRLESRLGRHGRPLWLAGLCHDLGKATAFFQNYLHGAQGDPLLKAHALFGAFWVCELLSKETGADARLQTALNMAFVRSHHGRLDDLRDALALVAAEEERGRKRMEAADIDGIAAWLGEQLGGIPVPIPNFTGKALGALRRELNSTLYGKLEHDLAMRRFQTALRDFGWLITADRASASGEFPCVSKIETPALDGGHLERFRSAGNFGSNVAAVRLAKARDAVFLAAVAGAGLRPATQGNLWTLQVPTGAGKTLAALGWATERRRLRKLADRPSGCIFYALPFTSIIDQTAAVIRRLWPQAGELGGLAVHHHLADYGTIEEQRQEGTGKRDWTEAWRADVVCTTFVQIAHALFHGTTADARRFAALALGGILILDEAQALPAELWPTLRVALRSLVDNFGAEVLLLTATKPALFLEEDSPVELRPQLENGDLETTFDRYEVHVEPSPAWDSLRLVDSAASVLAADAAREIRSGLLLLNTVNEALAVHALAQQHPGFAGKQLFHLSTNLRPKDRVRILNEIAQLERAGEQRLLVATQVVEAGVDLTFDVVFRAEAPLDAIVQAAGRCNRHGIGPRGEVRVFPFRGNTAHLIYGEIKMAAARELLSELTSTFGGQPIPEPTFAVQVPNFFQRVANRMGSAQTKRNYVMKAVTAFEFAKLRGDDPKDPEFEAKRVDLISEDGSKVPVFIETDEEDSATWQQLVSAYSEPDQHRRRSRLRALRAAVGACVVEVPERLKPPTPALPVPLGHVPMSESASFYNPNTGWHRPISPLL